jgi:hypothetical protein
MVRTALRLVRDLLDFVALACSSHSRLAAENLFLRRQLACYLGRKVKPRRVDDATRVTLVVLARFINWHKSSRLCSQTPSCDGTVRAFDCSGAGNHGAVAVPGFLRTFSS